MSSSANKRHSILPPLKDSGPRAPVRFSSSLVISDSAILTGTHTITLRTESLVHPRARLESSTGPVDVGKRCIIQERTHVGAIPQTPGPVPTKQEGTSDAGPGDGVLLKDYSVVEAGAVVEAGGTVIGEGTRVGVGSRIERGAIIGDYCTISPRTVIPPGTKIENYTVVFSQNQQRRDKRDVKDIRKRQQVRQLEVLQKLIPSNPAKFG